MESLEPLINLVALLTVLSVMAERVTNILKLRHTELKVRKDDQADERKREYGISLRGFAVGIFFALAAKANMFEIIAHLDSPWDTLGWVHIQDRNWTAAEASKSVGTALYAVAGCILTGAALGFGSKFWHDVLGALYDFRNMARGKTASATAALKGTNDGN